MVQEPLSMLRFLVLLCSLLALGNAQFPSPTANDQRAGAFLNSFARDGRQFPSSSPTPPPTDDKDQCPVQFSPPTIKPLPDTKFSQANIDQDITYNDLTGVLPGRFSDMGYLIYGYDLYKGNLLTYGFDPGFRHPLFYHGPVENYERTFDGRHTQPYGTVALPAQACTATFQQTTIQTVEDFQEMQGSVYNEERGFSFDGEKLTGFLEGLGGSAAKALSGPVAKGVLAAVKSTKASHASVNNEEYKKGRESAMRSDSQTILADAECNVYQAKLNFQAPPPLLPEVKAWITKMLKLQKDGQIRKLRNEIVNFLDFYGTHIISEVNFGAKYMYNFTITSKEESEVLDDFKSFKKAVNNELNILGFGLSSSTEKNKDQTEKKSTSKFEELVETTIKSIGAALPDIKDDGKTPDSIEWAKRAIENPVPTKLEIVSIERILDEQFLNNSFIENTICTLKISKEAFTSLKEQFVLMLPRKVVTVCERREKHCKKVKKEGKELARAKMIFECAEMAVQFEKNEEGRKFEGLLDILLLNATEEEKQCVKKTKITDKLKTAFEAFETHLDLNLFDLVRPGPLGGVSGIFEIVKVVGKGTTFEKFANVFGITFNDVPEKCKSAVQQLLEGDPFEAAGKLFTDFGNSIVKAFGGTDNKAEEECMKIAKDLEKKMKLWEKYGSKILMALTPENIARDCFYKNKCCTKVTKKACIKLASRTNDSRTYIDLLSDQGGVPTEEIITYPDAERIKPPNTADLEDAKKNKEVPECLICEDDPEEKEPEECPADQVRISNRNSNSNSNTRSNSNRNANNNSKRTTNSNRNSNTNSNTLCTGRTPWRCVKKGTTEGLCQGLPNCLRCEFTFCPEDRTPDDKRRITEACLGKGEGETVSVKFDSEDDLVDITCPTNPRRARGPRFLITHAMKMTARVSQVGSARN